MRIMTKKVIKFIALEQEERDCLILGIAFWLLLLETFVLPRIWSSVFLHQPSFISSFYSQQAFSSFISSLRSPISQATQPPDSNESSSSTSTSTSTPFPSNTLFAPTFSHSSKDPVPRNLAVLPSHRIVIAEGLYCNLDEGEWRKAAEMFDLRIMTLLDKEVAKKRLRERHVATGVAKDDEEAVWRGESRCWIVDVDVLIPLSLSCLIDWRSHPLLMHFSTADNNDLPNGDYLLAHILEPALKVPSLDEPSWAGAEWNLSFASQISKPDSCECFCQLNSRKEAVDEEQKRHFGEEHVGKSARRELRVWHFEKYHQVPKLVALSLLALAKTSTKKRLSFDCSLVSWLKGLLLRSSISFDPWPFLKQLFSGSTSLAPSLCHSPNPSHLSKFTFHFSFTRS